LLPRWSADPAEEIALVARARREGMLRAYRNMLRREDLEDCLSQAVFELLARGARGQRFVNRNHVANALEQRFLSRVYDRRRALHGRSPLQAALENALPLGCTGEQRIELADPRAEVLPLVVRRFQLRQVARLAPLLTPDQRLVLASQVALGMERAEFCRRFGWSFEKYRKVAQRARARLGRLLEDEPWGGADAGPRGGGADHDPGGSHPNLRAAGATPIRAAGSTPIRGHVSHLRGGVGTEQ
jgi:DNA-directed RNA polymerase specialized sigma24 family protein